MDGKWRETWSSKSYLGHTARVDSDPTLQQWHDAGVASTTPHLAGVSSCPQKGRVIRAEVLVDDQGNAAESLTVLHRVVPRW